MAKSIRARKTLGSVADKQQCPVENGPESAGIRTESTGLVSIVVPCCGQLEYTRLCVRSVVRHSRRPYELVFLDIGSLDGTKEYLAGVAATADASGVEVVAVGRTQGLFAAYTQALARSRGDFILLLANDTIVSDMWLNDVVSLAEDEPAIGVVGPMSNYAPGPQRVDRIPYQIGAKRCLQRSGEASLIDVEAVHRFAREWRQENGGHWFEVESLAGFCLLFTRKVADTFVLLNAESPLGVCDDIGPSLCTWAKQRGYRLACCGGLFIHNFGSRIMAAGRKDNTGGEKGPGVE